MVTEPKQTLLHDWHISHGAYMGRFGGYDMPLWYPSGTKKEHISVVTCAGIFDTSHMAIVLVKGPHAFALLQLCFSKDLNSCVGKEKTPLKNGRCIYGVFLNEHGETIDDAIVYQIEQEIYLIIVNSGMGHRIADHLSEHKDHQKVRIRDLTGRVGKIDIQGPMSGHILKKILQDHKSVFNQMPFFSFKGHFDSSSPQSKAVTLKNSTPILLSRTGYTGEFGFEMLMDSQHLVNTWNMVIEAGKEYDALACGLAARDSLRVGAGLPLSHQDIGSWPFINNPWDFALPYNYEKTAFTKDFIGSHALTYLETTEYTYSFAGYDLRKISAEQAVVTDTKGNEIGSVLSCATDIAIGRYNEKIYSISSPNKPNNFYPRGLCCGFVKVNTPLSAGDVITLNDSRRSVQVMIVTSIRPDRTARKPLDIMI